VARVVFTGTADADAIAIVDDLTAKAGANVAARYDADFDALTPRIDTPPRSP
jgi:hypothetical protein